MISILLSFPSVDLNNSSYRKDTTKITVVGRAFVNKFSAGVMTNDNFIYYLDGVGYWKEKYREKE